MKKRIKFKNLLFIISLAFAGIFVFCSMAFNSSTMEKAEAAPSAPSICPDYFYVSLADNIDNKIKKSTIDSCCVCFYNGSTVIGTGYPGTTLSTKEIASNTYGKVKSPSNLLGSYSLIVNDGTSETGGDHRTANKSFYEGLDTYIIDYQGRGTVLGVGDYCSGYWTKQIYVDITDSSWIDESYTSSDLEIMFYTSSWSDYIDMEETNNHAGFSYENNMGFAVIPKNGDSEVIDTVPTMALVRVKGTSDLAHKTISFPLKSNSSYVYKVSSATDSNSRSVEAISLDNYDITYQNYNGETLMVDSTPYGDVATYDGSAPIKPSSGSVIYTFNDWSPSLTVVTAATSYTATFSETTSKMRLYIQKTWGGTPYVGNGFGPANQPAAVSSIAADASLNIPASGTSVVSTHSDVQDIALSGSGQTTLYCTYFEDNTRWAPWRSGQDHDNNGFNNAVGLNDAFSTTFNNGCIYYLTDFAYADYYYNCNDGWWGRNQPDSYDGYGSGRTVKWYTYNIYLVGVFVHYDLNGAECGEGTENPTFVPDIEHKLGDDLELPAAPVRSGYTFMGWECSTNGILNNAETTYEDLSTPISFRAIWHSNTIPVVSSDNVRLWVGYSNSNSGVGSVMYNGLGCYCKLWIHQGNNSAGTEEHLYAPTGTYYSINENPASDLTSCPRRFDYYDIPVRFFTSGYYLNIQRYLANGEAAKYDGTTNVIQTGQIQLSNDDINQSFKVLYVAATWENAPGFYGITTNKTDAMFAAISLAGMHTCSSKNLNGYGGYDNWEDVFLQNVDVAEATTKLKDYTIVDFVSLSKYTSDSDISKSVTAYNKYLWCKYMAGGSVGPMPGPGLARVGFNPLINEDSTLSTIIIVIASSISLLSITALSVLVIKKRKQKE